MEADKIKEEEMDIEEFFCSRCGHIIKVRIESGLTPGSTLIEQVEQLETKEKINNE